MALSGKHGVIELSYARSAGTGNAPVPAEVTSRRTSTRSERVAVQKKKEVEAERQRKLTKEQEEAGRLLAQMWAQQDREDKRKSKRRKRSHSRDEDDRDRRPRRRENSSKRDMPRDAEEERDQVNDDDGIETNARDKVHGVFRGVKESAQQPAGMHWNEEPAAQEQAAAQTIDTRQTQVPPQKDTGSERPSLQMPDRRSAAAPASMLGHSGKVAGVFALSDSDDERTNVRREMERASMNKRGALAGARVAPQEQRAPGSSSSSTGTTAARSFVDHNASVLDVQMKLAKWKRECKGKRVPMPKDLEDEVARVMGSGAI